MTVSSAKICFLNDFNYFIAARDPDLISITSISPKGVLGFWKFGGINLIVILDK
jgi:hypothetical protein